MHLASNTRQLFGLHVKKLYIPCWTSWLRVKPAGWNEPWQLAMSSLLAEAEQMHKIKIS